MFKQDIGGKSKDAELKKESVLNVGNEVVLMKQGKKN